MSDVWDVEVDAIKTGNGEIWAENTNHRITMGEAVHIAKSRGVVPVGSATFGTDTTGLDPVDGSGRPWQAYVFGCQVAEVEVDTVTGEVQVLGVWAAHDVGRAVNPQGVEGQIEGGIVQALGQALMEDYELKDGHTIYLRLCQIHSADLARRAAASIRSSSRTPIRSGRSASRASASRPWCRRFRR